MNKRSSIFEMPLWLIGVLILLVIFLIYLGTKIAPNAFAGIKQIFGMLR